MKDNDYNVKAEYWHKVITQCNNRSSDINKAEWLDQHGIAHATYYKWQRLLRDDAIEQINDQKQLPEQKAFVDITPNYYRKSRQMRKLLLPVAYDNLFVRFLLRNHRIDYRPTLQCLLCESL